MSKPQPQSAVSSDVWITVAEAARLIDRTERQIRRYIESGRLPAMREKKPGSNDRHTLVQRAALFTIEPVATSSTRLLAAPAGSAGALAIAAPKPPPAEAPQPEASPWITIAEAGKRYGMPRPWLLEMATEGVLDAVQVLGGNGIASRWLIHTASLEDRELAKRWRALNFPQRAAHKQAHA